MVPVIGSEGVVTMAKKMGRPKTSVRRDSSVKFDKTLADMAQFIAKGRGISRAEYLSEMSRKAIERDYAAMMREFDELR